MKKQLTLSLLFLTLTAYTFAAAGTFTVGGSFSNYYPVTFADGGWFNNDASTLELGRSSVHEDSYWRGALMSKFTYHLTDWGNGANFIDADIQYSEVPFIAGWRDASSQSNIIVMVVWLRGGGTSYNYTTNYPVNIAVYDNVQNTLPYQEPNGPAWSYKTDVDPYVNSNGLTTNKTMYFNSPDESYFNGGVGIGTYDTNGYQLAVKGNIHAQQVNVDLNNWADYVFNSNYHLQSLSHVKEYIDQNHHLPDIPSEAELVKNGLNLGEMNKLLTKKVEELTLYLIEEHRENESDKTRLNIQQKEINRLNQRLDSLTKSFANLYHKNHFKPKIYAR